jgi:hypothetical protein
VKLIGSYEEQVVEESRATIDLQIAGLGAPIKVVTFTALSYKVSAEKKPVMDSQGQIIRYTIDNQKIDSSVSMLRSEWVVLRRSLVQQFAGQGTGGANLGILQVAADWTVTYGNSVLNYQTDQLFGVMFQADAFDSKNDQSPLEFSSDLFMTKMLIDGTAPIVYRPY